MAIRYVTASGGSTTASGTDPFVPITSTRALAVMVAGDTAIMAAGTYNLGTFLTANNGAAGSPITFEAEAGAIVLITRAVDVRDKDYITYRNVRIRGISQTVGAVANSLVLSNDASSHCTFDGCYFDSTNPQANGSDPVGNPFPFVGITLKGSFHSLIDCELHTWFGGDAIQMWGDHHYVKNFDARWGDNGHGTIINYSSWSIFDNCMVRNAWSRWGGSDSRQGDNQTGNVFQNCLVFDNGWDGTTLVLGLARENANGTVDNDLGDDNQFKPGATRLIIRNCLIVDTNDGNSSANQYNNVFQIGNYVAAGSVAGGDVAVYWQNVRFYHNTMYNGHVNSISVTYANTMQMFATDNRFFNNVLHSTNQSDHSFFNYTFYMATTGVSGSTVGQASYNWMDSWHIKNNLLANPIRHGTSHNGSLGSGRLGAYTVSEFEAAFGGSRVSGNIAGNPTLVNANYSAELADRDLLPAWNNFRLGGGSLGKGAAKEIAKATAASTLKRITVDDAYVFTNGNGIIPGDTIIIGAQTRTVTGIVDATHIDVDQNTTVANGDNIWLEMFGVAPDVGIAFQEAEGGGGGTVTLAINATPLVKTGSNTNSTSATSASLSPTAGALLLAIVSATNSNNPGGGPVSISLASGTLAGVGSWTKIDEQTNDSTTDTHIAMFWAVATGSPTPGTVVASAASNVDRWIIAVVEFTGANNSTPIVQSIKGTNFAATPSLTLGTTPVAGNIVLGAINARGEASSGVPGITPGTGYTEIMDESPLSSGTWLQIEYKDTSLGTTVNWSDANTTRNVYMAVEIAAGGSAYTMTAGTGAFTLTGVAAALKAQRKVSAGASSFLLNEVQGQPMGILLAFTQSRFPYTTFSYGRKAIAATATFTLSGQALSLLSGKRMALAAGTFALTGVAATFHNTYAIKLDAGSFALSGQTLEFRSARKMPLAAGSYAWTGVATNLLKGYAVALAAGSFALTGQAVTPLWGKRLPLAAGTYVLTGNAITYKAARFLSADNQAYILAGQAASLFYQSTPEPGAYEMIAGPGNFSLNGQTTILQPAHKIALGAAAFVLSGQALAQSFGRRLIAAPSSYILSGISSSLLFGRKVTALPGSFVLVGHDLGSASTYVLSAVTAAYVVTGRDMTLVLRPFVPPPPPTVRTFFAGPRKVRIRYVQSRNP